ncbi:MAG TPA: hypothetical protein VFM46_15440, partial [Pseudomonadales bacterium]|nr:hypothetical protein [Pseudomonadales bacterium]
NDKFKKVFDVTPSSSSWPHFKPVVSLTFVVPVPSFKQGEHKPKMCAISNRFSWHDRDYDEHHKFGNTFGVKGKCKHDVTLLAALKGSGTAEKDLMREGAAALLNAKSELNYQYSEEQVISMVQGAYNAGNFAEVAAQLKAANEQNCPLK